VVERLEGHARGQATVAADGYHLAVVAALLDRLGHAQRRADGGGRVADAEGVVVALVALGEAGETAPLAHCAHALAPAREDLVRIRLMAHVPDDAVVRGIVDRMQRDGELDRAQAAAEMPARVGHRLDMERAHLVVETLQRIHVHVVQLAGRLQPLEQGEPGGLGHQRLRVS